MAVPAWQRPHKCVNERYGRAGETDFPQNAAILNDAARNTHFSFSALALYIGRD
jgi:hypothetical protein